MEDDTQQSKDRLPPGQRLTTDFPVLHYAGVPRVDLATWRFEVAGEVAHPLQLSHSEFLALPKVTIISDFHCVTGWSRFDNRWEGVGCKEIASRCAPLASARFVTISSEDNYTTSLPLEQLLDDDVLLAYAHDGKQLAPEHGGPLRLIVPKRYAYKSAKWVKGLKFTVGQEIGFWEDRGYSNSADPWKEERYGRP